ncbi:MAG: tRNA preQ1(34) S-adenosylmethionine ribosyltransferase-isomerase QueA [Eubacteriales bacterium]
MKLEEFDYFLPKELIAQEPIEPRDSSRMMVVDRSNGEITHNTFLDIENILKSGDVLVLNKTKVIPARLIGEKSGTGAKIEVLLLNRIEQDVWEVLIKPAKRLKIGQKVVFGQGMLVGELIEVKDDGNRIVKFQYEGIFEQVLDELGQMPLPPYIYTELKDQGRYQTVYAKDDGSAAAPTAGLHFTEDLLTRLQEKGIEVLEILLHVGLGTFRPVKVDDILEHKMHSEYYRIEPEIADKINKAKGEGRRIVAVGTTVTRTLEALSKTDSEGNNFLASGEGWTDIFIYPGYKYKMVDVLITNFHFPKSTLIMLVSAFAGKELIFKAYEIAVKSKYRFYSFGDCMIII